MVQARLKTLLVTPATGATPSGRRATVLGLNPEFSADVFKYTLEVGTDVEAVEISAAAGRIEDDEGLSIKLLVAAGNGVVALTPGRTTKVDIVVAADDPTRASKATYSLAIRRAQCPKTAAKNKRMRLGTGAALAAVAALLGVALARK
eukprot:jgi/Tetstr1/429694/TSEL_019589.t1